MLYHKITIGDKDYDCRLTTKALVDLEKKMNGNPLNVFIKVKDGSMPKLSDLLIILHASLPHGISMDDVYDLYDRYVDSGKGFTDLIEDVTEICMVSGLLQREDEQEEEKN